MAQKKSATPSFPAADSVNKTVVTYKIIAAPENTFGYNIYLNGTIFLHQVTIPAVQGYKGFPTKTGAIRTAMLVVKKIKAGQMPPSVSAHELKDIKAI